MNGKATLSLLLILGLVLGGGWGLSAGLVIIDSPVLAANQAADPSAPQAESAVIKAARGAVKASQQKQVKFEQLYRNGIITLRELEHARVQFVEASIRLHKLKKDRPGTIEQLRQLLVIRQRQTQAADQLVQKKVLDKKTLEDYRLKEAQAQVRLGLQTIVRIREGQLEQLVIYHKRNLVAKKKVDDARETLSTALARLRMVGSRP